MSDKLTVKLDVTCQSIEQYFTVLREAAGGGYIEITYDGRYWHVLSDAVKFRGNAPTLERATTMLIEHVEWTKSNAWYLEPHP